MCFTGAVCAQSMVTCKVLLVWCRMFSGAWRGAQPQGKPVIGPGICSDIVPQQLGAEGLKLLRLFWPPAKSCGHVEVARLRSELSQAQETISQLQAGTW